MPTASEDMQTSLVCTRHRLSRSGHAYALLLTPQGPVGATDGDRRLRTLLCESKASEGKWVFLLGNRQSYPWEWAILGTVVGGKPARRKSLAGITAASLCRTLAAP